MSQVTWPSSRWLPDGDLGARLNRLYGEAKLKFLRTFDPNFSSRFDQIPEGSSKEWNRHLLSLGADVRPPSFGMESCVRDFTWEGWWYIPREVAEKIIILGFFPLPETNLNQG